MRIGVVAVQGAFAEHIAVLERMGISAFEIRQEKDLSGSSDGLILPGCESTVMKKLLRELCLYNPIKELINNGVPVFGTCAGMILLSEIIESGEESCFGTMNVTVKRNAYGRQLGSFRCIEKFDGNDIEMPFIRAPYITEVREDVEVLAVHEGRIVAVRQGNQLATAFHPELTDDNTVFNYFINMIKNRVK